MRKQLKLFIILLITITFTFLNLSSKQLFPVVNATYVEGEITQDTVWTLVDSPFVVSNDVIVYPGVTLTIEPEVEVRFGGNFSLIINGTLIANGAENKLIKFTSEKEEPEAGDWASIKFEGSQSSSLRYCVIEYGTNGITLENGTLNIQKSVIHLNSENGIEIMNGTVEVKNNEIAENGGSGIYIAGGNKVTVQDNTVSSNENGVTLTGNLTSEINIQQNKILSNAGSGISLEASGYDKTIIRNNNISANHYGFHVLTNTSTYITHNYISNNTVGIFYEKGNHTACFNDIYDNDLGMDVSADAIVNATYNYWGDKTGPYHESLNPHGKGNPVGGNGVNLDFIFFLTAPIDYNNTSPTAVLWTDKTLVAPNQNVTFIGTDSYDDGRVDQYFFDFGDGSNSGWTTLSLFTHTYTSNGTYSATLMVKDDFGNKSDKYYVTIKVQNLPSLETSITLSNYTVNYNEKVSVTVYVSNGTGAVENANVTLFSVKGGSFTPISGLTNSTGYFTATYTAPNVTEVTDIRIIAKASKTGYADGSDYKYLKVIPPLKVQVTSEPATIKSEGTATVTVQVTDAFEQPVADALLLLSSDYGTLSTNMGVTDANGTLTLFFFAPQTLSQIDVTVTATAIKMGYADTQGQGTITVEPRILVVEVTADPAIIISEAVSTITVHVTSDTAPISNATITASSDSGGNFSIPTETTDSNGDVVFTFTAPQTTVMLNVIVTVSATKNGYVSGEGQTAITVAPKVLSVQATAQTNATISEGKINVTVHVTYNTVPVSDVNVTITSENGGYFSENTGLTDVYGNVTFVFTAPPVNEQTDIILKVNASKTGYVDSEGRLNLTVNPGILNVEVTATPSVIKSEETTVIEVYVKCNDTSVADALVTVSASNGTLSALNGTTDSLGHCTFTLKAPQTLVQIPVVVTVNASKNGFLSVENETTVTVTPGAVSGAEGGFPWVTVLLIAIPIVIAVIIVVLVKLKIINVTFEESEEA